MNISSVSVYRPIQPHINNKPSFKGFDWDEDLIPDNDYDRQTRDRLRFDMYSRLFGISTANECSSSTVMSYARNLEDARILNYRNLGNSSYSGECLMHNTDYFRLLRPSGVTKIIDLIKKPNLEETCKEKGLDYYFYDMNWGYGKKSMFFDEAKLIEEKNASLTKSGLTDEEKKHALNDYISKLDKEKTSDIKELAKLIDVVNEGHFYMSCEFGEFRTVNCLALVSIFNPEWHGEKIDPTPEFAPKIEQLYMNLTEEHKQILGIDEDYYKSLGKYFDNLKQKYQN